MNWNNVLTFVGAFGLGGLISVFFQSFFNHRLNKDKMLFETRVQAYSKVIGKIFNLFQEIDMHAVPDEVKFTKLNDFLCESMLIAGHKLSDLIGDFKVKAFEFHLTLGKDEEKEKILHKELLKLVGKINDEMRKELKIDKKTLFEK